MREGNLGGRHAEEDQWNCRHDPDHEHEELGLRGRVERIESVELRNQPEPDDRERKKSGSLGRQGLNRLETGGLLQVTVGSEAKGQPKRNPRNLPIGKTKYTY